MSGSVGATTCGVTMTTSSVCCRWYLVDRNSMPITGTSPRIGTASVVADIVSFISPARAKLWPSASSTVVLTFRLVSPGIRNPLLRTALE